MVQEAKIIDKQRPNAKHVARACLECRSRHLRCSGTQPCTRCDKFSKECVYIKSNRGGSRKKGVSKFNKARSLKAPQVKNDRLNSVEVELANSVKVLRTPKMIKVPSPTTTANVVLPPLLDRKSSHQLGFNIPPVEDLIQLPCINHKKSPNERRKDYEDLLKMPCAFTCLEPQYRGRTPPCMGGEVRLSNQKTDLNQIPVSATSSFYEKVNSNDYVKKMVSELNIEDVIETYYSKFHKLHPVCPEEHEIREYLAAIPHANELILAMKIVGDAQSSSIYSTDIETVNFKLNQIFDYINTIVGIDVISLQAMVLIALIAHFSSLHDLSIRIRTEAVKALLSQGYNKLDQMDSEPEQEKRSSNMDAPDSPESEQEFSPKTNRFMSSERLSQLSKSTILECGRKVFWELYFVDVVIGTADGRTISQLATSPIAVDYPHSVPPYVFDYKSRADGCLLVTDAIKLNVSVIEKEVSPKSISLLNTSLGNWELRLNHPELLSAPFMIDANGNINEGVFQAMLLYNYARIFAHRPFSYLWKDSPNDLDSKLNRDSKQNITFRKIIETRKTIEGANLVATCLIDTTSSSIKSRTPLFGCSIAFASLVHLSSYIWAKSTLVNAGANPDSVKQIQQELAQYLQFIQFELNTLGVISKHWMLASKLSTYVKETLAKVTPELYLSIRPLIPRSISNNQPSSENTVKIEYPEAERTAPKEVNGKNGGKILSFSDLSSSSTGGSFTDLIPQQSQAAKLKKARIAEQISDYVKPADNVKVHNNSYTQEIFNRSQTSININNNSSNNNNTAIITANNNSNLLTNNNNTTNTTINNNSVNETDFTHLFQPESNYLQNINEIPGTPMSDTGCDWIDKAAFEFEGEEFTNILESYGLD